MKNVLIAFAMLLCAACATDHGKPAANLTFLSMSKRMYGNTSLPIYTMILASDQNFSTFFKQKNDQTPIFKWLFCSLNGDEDFSVTHRPRWTLDGNMASDPQRNIGGKYIYKIKVNFYENLGNGNNNLISDREIIKLFLVKNSSIPCKLMMTVFLRNPYYSETMHIPSNELLKVIGR